MSSTQREIEQGVAFLASLKIDGPVFAALKPVIDKLQSQYGGNVPVVESVDSDKSAQKNEGKLEIQTMIVAIHKCLVEEGFICVVEKPSSVVGKDGRLDSFWFIDKTRTPADLLLFVAISRICWYHT